MSAYCLVAVPLCPFFSWRYNSIILLRSPSSMLRVAAGRSFLFPFSCSFVGVWLCEPFFFPPAEIVCDVCGDVVVGSISDFSSRFDLRPGLGTVSFLFALRGSVFSVGGAWTISPNLNTSRLYSLGAASCEKKRQIAY